MFAVSLSDAGRIPVHHDAHMEYLRNVGRLYIMEKKGGIPVVISCMLFC